MRACISFRTRWITCPHLFPRLRMHVTRSLLHDAVMPFRLELFPALHFHRHLTLRLCSSVLRTRFPCCIPYHSLFHFPSDEEALAFPACGVCSHAARPLRGARTGCCSPLTLPSLFFPFSLLFLFAPLHNRPTWLVRRDSGVIPHPPLCPFILTLRPVRFVLGVVY